MRPPIINSRPLSTLPSWSQCSSYNSDFLLLHSYTKYIISGSRISFYVKLPLQQYEQRFDRKPEHNISTSALFSTSIFSTEWAPPYHFATGFLDHAISGKYCLPTFLKLIPQVSWACTTAIKGQTAPEHHLSACLKSRHCIAQ